MDLLGFRFHPGWIGLNCRSRRRLMLRFRGYAQDLASGRISELEAQQRMTACLAFVAPAQSRRYRGKLLSEMRR